MSKQKTVIYSNNIMINGYLQGRAYIVFELQHKIKTFAFDLNIDIYIQAFT